MDEDGPELIVQPGRMAVYREVSKQVFAVFESYTDRVGKLSIDEAFLDVTGCELLFGPAREIAEAIAAENGIAPLTEKHWQVIDFCRADNEAKGTPPGVRRITKNTGISTKEMYALFPKGPGVLSSKIAGLSKPKGCI